MSTSATILNSIENGVWRHWRFSKNLHKIKPEYLRTVFVADEISNSYRGFDSEMRLEEEIRSVAYELIVKGPGMRTWFTPGGRPNITRPGKVDIFLTHFDEAELVELKNIDPSSTEVEKEFVCLSEFLLSNSSDNACQAGYIAFPTTTDKRSWLELKFSEWTKGLDLEFRVDSVLSKTGEEEGGGIPEFYAYCVSLTRAASESV